MLSLVTEKIRATERVKLKPNDLFILVVVGDLRNKKIEDFLFNLTNKVGVLFCLFFVEK